MRLTTEDWEKLYELFDASTLVDDLLYERLVQYREDNGRAVSAPLPALEFAAAPEESAYSISALPASPDPVTFAEWHSSPKDVPVSEFSAYAHDRNLYKIPEGVSSSRCLALLGQRFKSHPFIRDTVRLIRQAGAAPFGQVKAWMQATCRDKPVPYRWELTRNTRVLYDWLAYFYDEVSWDRPNHSMVIRWTPRT